MAVPEATHAKRRHGGQYPTGFPVRCTDAEKREIFVRAGRASRSASRYLVELALAENGEGFSSLSSPEELGALEGLMVQLRRVASNLNELARREQAAANRDADAPPAAEIEEAVLEVRGMLDQIRARLI